MLLLMPEVPKGCNGVMISVIKTIHLSKHSATKMVRLPRIDCSLSASISIQPSLHVFALGFVSMHMYYQCGYIEQRHAVTCAQQNNVILLVSYIKSS